MSDYIIGEQLLNEIMALLGKMPYMQVSQLISKIHNGVKPLEEKKNGCDSNDKRD